MRRLLSRRISVGAMLEFLLWLALPYLIVGLVWTFLHPHAVEQVQKQWDRAFPAVAPLAALVEVTVAWPPMVAGVEICPTTE
ncbi:hypothetical protein BOO86_24235 [Mycobacterium sp. CBMA 234]|uniref:hypothetical protein n=1 Tax=Mycolicibacterium sp. CBMA 234 TaxID=1918495 RepID=UPI0012DCBB2D|nr:hypothetical protein [Mycolicibacterium sp. CBMA 234]MUL67602.1 hypothetical protein [Mycolicibacterium sp. CBMA 234]